MMETTERRCRRCGRPAGTTESCTVERWEQNGPSLKGTIMGPLSGIHDFPPPPVRPNRRARRARGMK